MKPPEIPPAARRLLEPLAEAAGSLPLFVVGGPVRDWLLGRRVFDIDLCCEGDPEPLARLVAERLGGTAESFGRFGTWRVLASRLRFDLAMCRRETYAAPAALPDVAPAGIEEDLRRRDFTINAMALRLRPDDGGELIDPYGGAKDLKGRVLRELHPESFRDDPTRVFRAARYLCRFALKPAPGLVTLAEAALAEGHAAKLSRHRLTQELLRVLAENDCAAPLAVLKRWGYLDLIQPKLKAPPTSVSGVHERLATMALGMGDSKGEDFLNSLPIDHVIATYIEEALGVAKAKASPRSVLAPLAVSALKAAYPKLPPAALKPVFLNGRDLEARGLKPGVDFRDILDAAAMLQWKGRLRSRAQALAWLDKALRRR